MNHWSMWSGISRLPGHVMWAENSDRMASLPRTKRTMSRHGRLLMRCRKTDPLFGRKATHWFTSVFGFDRGVGAVDVDLPFGCRLLQDTLADGRRRLLVDGIEIHAESMARHTFLEVR